MTDEIKVKVTADGAAQAATQVDKLTAALEKQKKTTELIAKTEKDLKREVIIGLIKKESIEVNKLETAYSRFKSAALGTQQAVGGASASISEFGNNTQKLRQHLSPAAALVGGFSNSLSVLVPEAGGATKALQTFGLAGSQMLGVLGGGPGIIIGGLIAGVGALASYMASTTKEADDLAKATEANAKAMGSYLDQLQKLRGEVTTARGQQKTEDDLRKRISHDDASVDELATEIELQRRRIQKNANDVYSPSQLKDLYASGKRDQLVKALKQQKDDQARIDELLDKQIKAGKTVDYASQNAKDKKELEDAIIRANAGGTKSKAFDLGAANDPLKPKPRGDMNVPDSIRKIDEMIIASQEKVKDYEKQQSLLGFDEWKTQQQQKAELEQKARDDKFTLDAQARKQEQQDFASHMQQLASGRKIYQDLAVQGSNIVAGSAIKSFQMIAKGQKAEIGAILEGIGDQIVAMGTGYIFKGTAESILLNPQGPALIGVGTGAVAFGIGLGAVGARQAGGSTATGAGAAGANASPFGANPYSNPTSPVNQNTGPTIININMPTVLSPSAEDGLRIQQAIDAKVRVYGR